MKRAFIILVVSIIIASVDCINQTLSWSVNNTIKSGELKLISTTAFGPKNNAVSYAQPFSISFKKIPMVAISILSMDIDQTSNPISYSPMIYNINQTYFSINVSILSSNTINLLTYFYLGIEKNTIFSYIGMIYRISLSNLTDKQGASQSLFYDIGNITNNEITSIANYDKSVVVPYPFGFTITSSVQYSIYTIASMINSTALNITIYSNSSLTYLDLNVVIIDKYTLEINQTVFIDYGSIYYIKSIPTPNIFQFIPLGYNYYNSIAGAVHFREKVNQPLIFLSGTYTINTTSSFQSVNMTTVFWRFRLCNAATPYYLKYYQRCFDVCPTNLRNPSYATNTVNKYCIQCHISCYECQGDGVSCISCVSINNITNVTQPFNISSANTSGTFRYFNSSLKKCPCLNGYFEVGNQICQLCSFQCSKCQIAANNCSICSHSTRNSSISNCPCNFGYFQNLIPNKICEICSKFCETCKNISVNCTTCRASSHRQIDVQNARCVCSSGYGQNGTQQICMNNSLNCILPCLTCKDNPTSCVSCNLTAKRYNVNKSCICFVGYFAKNSTADCSQICGDGLMFQDYIQCDDGNNNNGDGCSKNCMIQSNYTCKNPKTSPSICIFTKNYTSQFINIQKVIDSNTATCILKIFPAPPASTVPTLTSYLDQLEILSYSLSGEYMTVNLNVKKQTSLNLPLKIALNLINSTVSIPLSQSINLSLLKPYSNEYLILYKASNYLVWIYIALLWIGSIVLMVKDYTQLNSIIQLFVYSSVAWIGVEGQKYTPLLYKSLTRLVYIFGYNIQYSSKASLFDVLNVGLLLNLLPIIIFVILIPISKRKPQTFTIRVKRFILFDLTYAFLIINAFQVVFGLGLCASFSNQKPSIGSIIFGTIYMLIFVLLSYWLFIKNKSQEQSNSQLQVFKHNLIEPQYLPAYYLFLLLGCFLVVSLKNVTNLNGLVMISIALFIFIFVGFKNFYINKIRNMMNLISLILIYGCYVLIANVPAADWSGFAILALMYIQIFFNFIFIYLEGNKIQDDVQSDGNQDFQRQRVKIFNSLSNDNYNFNSLNSNKFQTNVPQFHAYEIPKKTDEKENINKIKVESKKQLEKLSEQNKQDKNRKSQRQIKTKQKIKNEQFLPTDAKNLLIDDQDDDMSAREVNMDEI